MVLLIVASPCALAVTDIPATLSAISNTARKGVLFKGGSYIATLSDMKVIAFDKTGTLTTGKPVVTDDYFIENASYYQSILVNMEETSNHPLARAILDHYPNTNKKALEVKQEIGIGLTTVYEGRTYKIAKPSVFKQVDEKILTLTETLSNQGKTVVYMSCDEKVIGLVALQDVAKENINDIIAYFKKEDVKTVMITGDAQSTALKIAETVGIDEVKANVMPQEKQAIVEDLKQTYGLTAMVGDGINDAPALTSAHIGIAMGDGTDIAIETADVVVMKNDLSRLTYAHQVSKKLKNNVIQNLIFSMLVIIFLITMNMVGHMDMPLAVLVHEGSTVVVILNALRLLIPLKEKKS